MKRTKFYFSLLWKPILIGFFVLMFSLVVLLSLQNEVPGGYSREEVAYFDIVKNGKIIPNNPIYLPVYLVHKIGLKVLGAEIINIRLINGLLCLGAVTAIFFILRRWYSFRIAALTSLIYITFTWLLVASRNALPEIMVLYSAFIPLLIVWIQKTKKEKFALIITALTLGLLLYAPGIVWFVLVGILWKFKSIIYILRRSPLWNVITAITVFLFLLIPFIVGLTNIEFIKSITGLYFNELNFVEYIKNIMTFIVNLTWNSNYRNGINIGSQAVFDIFALVLMTAGVINIIKKWKKSRSKYVVISIFVGILLIGLGTTVSNIIIMPYLILLLGSGLGWLLQQWLTVFPKNPFAQNIGLVFIVIAVIMTATYNTYRFYVAWPHMPTTEANYNIKQ